MIDEKNFDIVSLGEPMVEFNQTGQKQGRVFLQGFGGDTSNFSVSAARQGAKVSYLTALGEDPYGEMLKQMWRSDGIDIQGVLINPKAFTAIYFVTHNENGHQFDFFRKGSANTIFLKLPSLRLFTKAKVF